MSKHIHLSRFLAVTLCLAGTSVVTGCAAVSAVGAVAGMAGNALEMAGMKKPENAPIEVKLAIHAGENLNASSGQAMAAVTKIYYLKSPEAFQRAPLTQLIDTAQEKAALGETVLGARELTLTPGQRYEVVEKVPKTADYIGIAGLFYAPAPMRWKYVFKVKDAEDTGIVLGAHACALTVTTGKPTLPPGIPAYDPARLSGVQCPS
ncbi:type VI secretion system-associated lipoprotein [Bordetella genomosp. 5]|uniref:type VI secretion system lipoprotein TssJ n=1 Tax=Bordetella genomosp. 5 TaxID=1395608 RepID=UPI000B9E5FB1|nr:type VI secretion system lipoprotein TssJ [Bordetella genomosp. 5]OZI39634.1 type VI secretion system-associated lipoprotein [Bordetella genomosp. 5]